MNTVQSQYKNPDKFIEKLRGDIERLRYKLEIVRRMRGVHIFSYTKGVEKSVHLSNPTEHPELLPGTEVLFTGKVIEVHRKKDEADIKFELKQCRHIREEA